MEAYARYSLAGPHSISSKIMAHQRRRMFAKFLAATEIQRDHTLLDLGVSSDRSYPHSNFLELWYPHKDRITACGVDDASFLEELCPGVKFVRGDGRSLPFADKEFDFVFSNAVLEHVGSREKQAAFLKEAWRVARKGIFITTPNRWFPMEYHTVMPLAHWLPVAAFRRICKMRGLDFFASEENLNLLSSSDLEQLAQGAGMDNFRIYCVRLAGWPSNLMLSARRI